MTDRDIIMSRLQEMPDDWLTEDWAIKFYSDFYEARDRTEAEVRAKFDDSEDWILGARMTWLYTSCQTVSSALIPLWLWRKYEHEWVMEASGEV